MRTQVSVIYLTAQQERDAAIAKAAELKDAASRAEQRATAAEAEVIKWEDERNCAIQEVTEIRGTCSRPAILVPL